MAKALESTIEVIKLLVNWFRLKKIPLFLLFIKNEAKTNKVVVVELTYEKVQEMLNYLSKRQKADPVSGIEIVLNKDSTINKVLIQNEPLSENRTYYVATSDYLADLGDNMNFFSDPVSITDLDYLIRAQMIDYFKKVDTLAPEIDNRFIKLR